MKMDRSKPARLPDDAKGVRLNPATSVVVASQLIPRIGSPLNVPFISQRLPAHHATWALMRPVLEAPLARCLQCGAAINEKTLVVWDGCD